MGFSVTRTSSSLVSPCGQTPSDTLSLSVIDLVAGLRHMVRSLHVFKHGDSPAKVIRDAVSRALVPYYPFAGRLVDQNGDVRVACTGEGVWFVEATADCNLEDARYLDHPLLIAQDELLPVPGPGPETETEIEIEPINLPLLMIQVTEFTCGGYVVGLISIHTIADGLGAAQFINAVGEFARGLTRPTVEPVWSRDLIPNPPKPQYVGPPIFPCFKLQYFTMDFTQDCVGAVKDQFFDQTGQRCSSFDVCIAKVWQSRTLAIQLDPDTDVRLCFFANTRHLLHEVLPRGYYGNCFYPVTATAASGRVAEAELVEVVKIIREAKARLPAEFDKWAAGEFKKDDPYELTFTYNSLFVSDWTRLGFLDADYGWGKPVHMVPFAYSDIMSVAVVGAPPAPKKGVRMITQCVEMEHLAAFQAQMNGF